MQWCTENDLRLLDVRRAHLEIFGRQMEADGRMRSTVARRLSTLGSFYGYCHVEGILERNPAANVRRPKVDVESRTLGLARNELGALLVQAGLGSARDHALISLLTLNGLRISEALDAGVPLRDVQEAASRADPRTTMRYDRARQSLDRHATYIVAAFVAGASRSA